MRLISEIDELANEWSDKNKYSPLMYSEGFVHIVRGKY